MKDRLHATREVDVRRGPRDVRLEAFAEDYLIERLGPNETRLTWTVAITNTGFMSYLNPVTARVMKLVFRRWLKRYSEILEAHAAARQGKPAAQAAAS